jgi:MarR family transcriptional regulator, transcriptional regulator for hemolysin
VQPYDFENSLTFWVIQTAHAVERAFNEDLAPHGITLSQSKVLAWLAHDGELSQAELADRMRIEAPTLAGILDRMERDGWVERRPAPDDRRRKLVRATPQVDPVWAKIVQCARAMRARAVAGIDPDDVQRTMATLAAIQSNLKSDIQQPV